MSVAGSTKSTLQKKELFLTMLAEMGNIFRACEASGLDRGLAYKTKAQDAAFATEWDKAVEVAADRMEAEAWRRAMKGTERPVFHKGQEVGLVREYSDLLLIFMLKGIRPDKFRETPRLETHQGPQVNQFFLNAPPKFLEALADKLQTIDVDIPE